MSGLNSFYDYLTSLSPAMATLLLRGGVETLDSYARPRIITPGTAGVGLAWRRDKKGYYLGQEKSLTAGGGSISIVDSGAAPELRATSGTIFWTAKGFAAVTGSSRVIAKVDGGGVAWQLTTSGANLIAMTGGSTMTSASLAEANSVAVRFVTSQVPELFADGVFRVLGVGACAPTADDADLYMANGNTLATGSKDNDYGLFILFNDAIRGKGITNEEIKNLHELWRSIVSVFEPKKTIWLPRKSSEIITPAALVQLVGTKNASSLVLDQSGNGRNGTISGRVTQSKGPCCTRHQAHGAGNPLIAAASDTSLYPNSFSLELQYNARSRGQSDQGCLWSISDGGTTRSRLYLGAANVWYYEVAYAGATARWTFTAGPYNVDHILTLTHARSAGSAPVVKVDGETVTVTQAVAPSGALTAAAAPIVNRLNTAALDSDFDGALIEEKEFASVLSDADVRALYVAQALRCNVLAHRTDYPVSVAAVAAGGKVGPYRVLSGTHKWDDDGTRRRLLGVTAGYFALRDSSPQAYGGWYCRAMKATDAGTVHIPLSASVPNNSSFSGYSIRFSSAEAVELNRWTTGAVVVVASAAAAIVVGTEYELFVTRRPRDGYFVVWIRGGAYATWTSLLTDTDTTHTTSNCLVGYLDAGGTLSDVRQYPNGSGLVPTDVPGLED
ncbi:MAG: hypothetical protein WC683_19655 [bacterium]